MTTANILANAGFSSLTKFPKSISRNNEDSVDEHFMDENALAARKGSSSNLV